MINPSPLFGFDKKTPQFYKNIRIKTDTNLHEQLSEYIKSNFDISTKILDWGCGEGALSQKLLDLGYSVTSVDMNAKDFKAQTQFIQINFNNPDEINTFIHEYKESFDLILGIEVIEHVKSPWDYIDNISKLAHLNSTIIISTPNVSSWWGRFWFLLKGELWGFSEDGWIDPGHINPILDFEIKNILRYYKLHVIDFFNGGNQPIIWLYNWKRFLISLFFLPLYPFMQGIKKGWVNCYVIKKEK